MIEINTSKLTARKHVKIDGHEYTVRRLGAGDELEVQQILRRLDTLSKKSKDKSTTPEDMDKIEEEFTTLQEKSLMVYARTFDDGGDGSKSLELVKSLSYDERKEMMDTIFDSKEPDGKETPEETPAQ